MPHHISRTYTVSETAKLIGIPDAAIVAAMPRCGIRLAVRRNQKLQQAEVNTIRRFCAK